jgi:hypothetical protein
VANSSKISSRRLTKGSPDDVSASRSRSAEHATDDTETTDKNRTKVRSRQLMRQDFWQGPVAGHDKQQDQDRYAVRRHPAPGWFLRDQERSTDTALKGTGIVPTPSPSWTNCIPSEKAAIANVAPK